MKKGFLFCGLILSSWIISLSGCSQQSQSLYATLNTALLNSTEDVVLPPSYIEQLPWASGYAKIANNSQVFLVLGFADPSNHTKHKIEPYRLSWLSQQNESITTENGRLINTIGLADGNLIASYSRHEDPLQLGLHLSSTPVKWQREIDWQPGNYFSVALYSQFNKQHKVNLTLNNREIECLYFIEQVSVPSLAIEYQNHFWIATDNGKVIKSIQRVSPILPEIEFTLLKPYLA